jgi:hypothetical protein
MGERWLMALAIAVALLSAAKRAGRRACARGGNHPDAMSDLGGSNGSPAVQGSAIGGDFPDNSAQSPRGSAENSS